jgi:hypothetical protein
MPTTTDPFKTEQILWYNNGIWGQLGYAAPNFALGAQTQNETIQYLVYALGRNLSGVMHHPDADCRTPPTINTLTRIHKLVVRARTILGGRAVPPGTPDMEAVHVQPGAQDQLIFPVPYFKVHNQWMKEYAGLCLAAIAEACQHSENRQPFEISTIFAGVIGQYLQRIYMRLGTELLMLPPATITPNYVFSAADLAGYNPAAWFSGTEMIDVTPSLTRMPTDVDVRPLTRGIPASNLVGLALYPSGTPYNPTAPSNVNALGAVATPAAATAAASTPAAAATTPAATAPAAATPAVPAFATPPSP